MIKLQANVGDDLFPDWVDISSDDMIVFSNGYLSIDSGFTGVKRVIQEFSEIDTAYAKCCHLISNSTIQQINYNGETLYNAQQLFLADPDTSNTLNKLSFRLSFIDYIVDWVKIPRMYFKIPQFFYANSQIDTLITPFFYTSETGLAAGHVLEIDEYKFLVTKVEPISTYYKVWLTAYDINESITVDKDKYLIRDYNLPAPDSSLVNMPKVMFHGEEITLNLIPSVDISSDVTDLTARDFRTTYSQMNIDISNLPFQVNIDATTDLSTEMILSDFTLTHSISTGDNIIYGITGSITDIKHGDYILIKNAVYSEIFKVTGVNVSENSFIVSRPYTKYEFLTADDTVKVFWNKRIFFQPIMLNFGENLVNYPVLFNLEVKYLNI